jgi:mRNA-degrading endonuclease RelE of RelBE toxin-antitoxin system
MQVTILDDALADIDELPGAIQERVLDIVERLEHWPQVSGARMLTGNWRGHYRIRTGDYRVVFRALPDRIVVVRVANRKEVYE